MCGIAGIAGNVPIDPACRAVLREMLARLQHRGPDDEGQHADSHAMLGHRRLSIIDLETGRQPLSNEDGTIHAVVNGEFYDFLELRESLLSRGHVFRTTSDSECIVHLYEDFGEACIEHVSGMFAVAIWDVRRRKLLLARDRLGVKPLHYAIVGEQLAFASELKALLAWPRIARDIDPTALLDYLVYDFVPSPKTILTGVRKLAPGTRLMLEGGRARVERYWDLHAREPLQGSLDDTAAELWNQLKRATRSRLVSDVPVGALLSGGVDSAAVAASMARLSRQPVVTVTSGFAEAGFDERAAAEETARRIGSRHHDHVVQADSADLLDTLAWHFDEPFADPSAIPMHYLCMAARKHVTVALSGDGGDETLAGYRRYRFDVAEQRMRGFLPAFLRRRVFRGLAAVYPRWSCLPRGLRAGATLRNLAVDGATGHALSITALSPTAARSLLAGDLAAAVSQYDPLDHARRLYGQCDASDHLSKCQYVDIKLGLADGILTKVDRASMAHGLEVRSPMLDFRFVEFAWRIPPRMRMQGGRGKAPLRRALAHRLGPEIANRAKAGFEVPLNAWMRGPLRERMEDALSTRGGLEELVAPGAVRSVWRRHLSGELANGPLRWKLLMLGAWKRRHLMKPVETSHSATSQIVPPERMVVSA
ncbi:MAG TPA: asparagine synthase (glutamine-hydrolyzing) [Phycisphaerae bacterium]|nr:asparagine synthase (glutamine-hydrolyzing) [Phycisphaerae bacterium]